MAWSGLEVTTVDSVRNDYAKGVAPAGTIDARLAHLIKAVSAEFERYLDRSLLVASQTEWLSVYPDQTSWYLLHYPVQTIDSVQVRDDDDPLDATDYRLIGRQMLVDNVGALRLGDDQIEVTYTGGMAADTPSFVANYPDIVTAANMQVWHEYNRIGEEDAQSLSVGGQAVGMTGPVMLLKRVRDRLNHHRNVHP